MLSIESILMGRITYDRLPAPSKSNVRVLLDKAGLVEHAYGCPLVVTSGYRDPATNAAAGGAQSSKHLTCEALDVADPNGDVWRWCLANMQLLKQWGIWLEHPNWTHHKTNRSKRWVHFQTCAPKSGNRVFVPNSNPPIGDIWSGQCDPTWK